MSYRVKGGVQPPITVRPMVRFTETGGKVDISVASKHFPGPKIFADDVVLHIPFPKAVSQVILAASQGSFVFDPKSKVVTWTIGRLLSASKPPTLTGSVSLMPGAQRPESSPTLSA
jgi:AP-3 complex subunit mu